MTREECERLALSIESIRDAYFEADQFGSIVLRRAAARIRETALHDPLMARARRDINGRGVIVSHDVGCYCITCSCSAKSIHELIHRDNCLVGLIEPLVAAQPKEATT